MDKKYSFFLLIFYIFSVSGFSYNDNTRLNGDLLRNYDPRVRGTFNLENPTRIEIDAYVTSLVGFEELTGKFSFVAYFVLQWRDERLQWNASDYNGVSETTLYQSDIWHPLITPSRSSDEFKRLGFDWMHVWINSTGHATWVPGDIFHSQCSQDITNYPFDTQECDVEFIFMVKYPGTLKIVTTHDYIVQTLFTRHSQWNLEKSKTYTTSIESFLLKYHLHFTLKRESDFYVVGLILPIATLGLLNLLVFALPAESGERAGYSITVLLALAVFLTIASDSLPKTSKPSLPMICIKLYFDMVVSSMIMLFTIIGLRIYNTEESIPVPPCLAYVTRCCLCRKRKGKAEKISVAADTEKNGEDFNKNFNSEGRNQGIDDLGVSWKDVGKTFDAIFFMISAAAFIFSHSIWIGHIFAT